ncbi:MAG TPA: hypothetical protein PKV21_06570 [bacterium]|nr:hypothetical protein [bacterium]
MPNPIAYILTGLLEGYGRMKEQQVLQDILKTSYSQPQPSLPAPTTEGEKKTSIEDIIQQQIQAQQQPQMIFQKLLSNPSFWNLPVDKQQMLLNIAGLQAQLTPQVDVAKMMEAYRKMITPIEIEAGKGLYNPITGQWISKPILQTEPEKELIDISTGEKIKSGVIKVGDTLIDPEKREIIYQKPNIKVDVDFKTNRYVKQDLNTGEIEEGFITPQTFGIITTYAQSIGKDPAKLSTDEIENIINTAIRMGDLPPYYELIKSDYGIITIDKATGKPLDFFEDPLAKEKLEQEKEKFELDKQKVLAEIDKIKTLTPLEAERVKSVIASHYTYADYLKDKIMIEKTKQQTTTKTTTPTTKPLAKASVKEREAFNKWFAKIKKAYDKKDPYTRDKAIELALTSGINPELYDEAIKVLDTYTKSWDQAYFQKQSTITPPQEKIIKQGKIGNITYQIKEK